MLGKTNKLYISPDLLSAYYKNPSDFDNFCKSNPEIQIKNDVFCLAIIVLEMVQLDLGKRWHFEVSNKLNQDLINKSLYFVKAKYSQSLYDVLREMILINYKIRPDFLLMRTLLISKLPYIKVSGINLSCIDWTKFDLNKNTIETKERDKEWTNKKYIYLTNNDLWNHGGWKNINNKKMRKLSKLNNKRDFKNIIYSQQPEEIT